MTDHIVGLHVCPQQVRAITLQRVNREYALLALDEFPVNFPGSLHDPADPDPASAELAGALTSFMHLLPSSPKAVAVTFDAAFLFIAAIPTEPRLPTEALEERVAWELAQFFPDVPRDRFIADMHVIANPGAQTFDEMLVVAIRRELTRSVRRAIEGAGFTLGVVDADHFSTELTLKVNYPDTYSRYVALVGVKDSRMDVSLLRNGVLESYRYHQLRSRGDAVQTLGSLSRDTPGLASIMVYGPALDNALLVQLRQASAIVVEALNPLRHIAVAEVVQLAESVNSPPYRFAPAIGVALRRD
jgi:Tfp pilus assembly PilM family ATPase